MRLLQREDHVHLDSSMYAGSHRSDGFDQRQPREKWVKIHLQQIIFDGQKCLLVNFRDVSSWHQLKMKKEKMKMFRKVHRQLGKVTRDSKNVIKVLSCWLLDWHKERESELQVIRNVKTIATASRIGLFKSNNMLELLGSKLAAGDEQALIFKLRTVVKEVLDTFIEQLEIKKLTIEITYQSTRLKNSRFLGKFTLFKQVLFNVAENAIKFSNQED